MLPVYGKWEMELAQMAAAEAEALRRDLGMAESTLDRFVATTYRLLGLHAFFTVGPDECRAWTVAIGTVAPRAAGKIHSDMERGFIRAEVVAYDDFVAAGGMAAAKKAGTVRLEGKEYVVRDGDIINFRFNV